MIKPLSVVIAGLLVSLPTWALTVSAVGDIMMGTDYPGNVQVVERDFFRAAKPFLATTDLRFGNFEGTLYDGAQNADGKAGGAHRYLFRTPTQMVGHLTDAGFNVVSLANNHAHDFGGKGIQSTKQTLKANGIQFSSKDGEVAEFLVDGQRVALIACDFYPGNRSITTPAPTYAEIRELKKRYDLVIVSAHAGAEGFNAEHTYDHAEIFLGENRGNSIAFGHGAIDAGADLVLMSGPHVPRGLEIHDGHLIAYSLGNFLTEQGISIGGTAGLAPLLQVQIDKKGLFTAGVIRSFHQIRSLPISLDPNQGAAKLMQQMSFDDFPSTHPLFAAGGVISPSSLPPIVDPGAAPVLAVDGGAINLQTP